MFNSDRNVLGRVLKLSEEAYTVIGVLPPEAVFPDRAELWVPLAANPAEGTGWYLNGIGRLKQTSTPEQAAADLLHIHKAMIQSGHSDNEFTFPLVMPIRERYLGELRDVSRVLLIAVG